MSGQKYEHLAWIGPDMFNPKLDCLTSFLQAFGSPGAMLIKLDRQFLDECAVEGDEMAVRFKALINDLEGRHPVKELEKAFRDVLDEVISSAHSGLDEDSEPMTTDKCIAGRDRLMSLFNTQMAMLLALGSRNWQALAKDSLIPEPISPKDAPEFCEDEGERNGYADGWNAYRARLVDGYPYEFEGKPLKSRLARDGFPAFYFSTEGLPPCTHRFKETDIPVWTEGPTATLELLSALARQQSVSVELELTVPTLTPAALEAARNAPLPAVHLDSISAREDLVFKAKFEAAMVVLLAEQQEERP